MEFGKALIWAYSQSNCKDFADFIVKEDNKRKLSKQKENMKNIFIKFENKLLLPYVAGELRKRLPNLVREEGQGVQGKFAALIITDNKIYPFNYNAIKVVDNMKEFVISSACNADTIIEEVVKEYNKPEYETYRLAGHFNNNYLDIKIFANGAVHYIDQLSNVNKIKGFFIALLTKTHGLEIGGTDYVLITSTQGKHYLTRDEITKFISVLNDKTF